MSLKLYKQASEKYRPGKIRTLFVAESPPNKKEGEELRYFYFEKFKGKDFLFRSIIEVLFTEEYKLHKNDKIYLLNKLKENGFFLIDACEYPINQHQQKIRDDFVKKESEKLIIKIKNIVNEETKIILIKKNIYNILFERLKDRGFNVINKEHLDFPSCGNQRKFKDKLNKLLS